MLNCTNCESYNRGRGTQACKTCNIHQLTEIKVRLNCPSTIYSDAMVENSPAPLAIETTFDVLKQIDTESATMIFQAKMLKMTLEEIKAYHNNKYSKATISRKITSSATTIKKILNINQMFTPF